MSLFFFWEDPRSSCLKRVSASFSSILFFVIDMDFMRKINQVLPLFTSSLYFIIILFNTLEH